MSTKIFERCLVLHDVAKGLLLRTYVLKTKPAPCVDRKEWAKVAKKLEASFPDVPDVSKLQGFDSIVQSAQEIFDQTQAMYHHYLEVTEFLQQATMVINSLPALTPVFKLDKSHWMMVSLMQLITDFLKLHLLMGHIDERKQTLALHLFAHQATRKSAESSGAAVAATLKRFDKPLATISEELQGIADVVADVILEMRESITTAMDPDKLRQRNVLNPLEEGMVMVLPTGTPLNPRLASVPLHDELTYADCYAEWSVFAVFCCPAILIRPEILMLFMQLATSLLVIPIYANITFDIHLEAENLAKAYPPKGFNIVVPKTLKLKKDFKELAVTATQKCGEIRRERRSYLQGEISNLVALFKDVPGLLAPKFPMALAALSMAKAEVTYYFIHLSVEVPKARAKIYKVEDYFDSQISYLIGAVVELVELVKTHAREVQAYYSEYVQGAHRLAIEQLVGNCKGLARGAVQDIFDSLPKLLEPGGGEGGAVDDRLQCLRLDWGRAHAVLLSNESLSVMKNPSIVALVQRMRTVVMHSLFADSVHELLLERCELTSMWYFQGNMQAFFRECLSAADDTPRHALSFLRVLSGVADAVHESCPDEQHRRGLEAAKIGMAMMGELGTRVEVLLRALHTQLSGLAGQVAPIEAAYRYERSEGAGAAAQAEQSAGYESKPESARGIKPLIDAQISAVHLLWSIGSSCDEIVLYDRVFRPKELVRDKVQAFLRDVYRKEANKDGRGPPPPSHLAKVFGVACQCIQLVSTHIDLDVGTILRRVLFDEATACVDSPYVPGSSIANLSAKVDPAAQSVVLHYAAFYKRLCEEAVPGGPRQALVTPMGFLGSGMDAFTDVAEFKALYGLLGGYGMAILQSDLVRLVSARAERIKAFIVTNTSALHNFKQKHADPAGWEAVSGAVTRDLRGLDDFLVDACVIGNALSLRRIIAEAVRESQAMTVPFAVSSVAMAKMAIKPHAFEANPGLAFLAQESCGLMDLAHVDQSVKAAVQALGNSTQDVQSVWSYLPYAFAASFAAETWKSTAYDSSLDVMTNNVHAVGPAMAQLFRSFAAVPGAGDFAEQFVRSSSFFLLRMKGSELFSAYPLRAMCIFLDKFVAETGAVARGVLQENVPYAVLHSSFVDVAALGRR